MNIENLTKPSLKIIKSLMSFAIKEERKNKERINEAMKQ